MHYCVMLSDSDCGDVSPLLPSPPLLPNNCFIGSIADKNNLRYWMNAYVKSTWHVVLKSIRWNYLNVHMLLLMLCLLQGVFKREPNELFVRGQGWWLKIRTQNNANSFIQSMGSHFKKSPCITGTKLVRYLFINTYKSWVSRINWCNIDALFINKMYSPNIWDLKY
jgi:hypothetical protein